MFLVHLSLPIIINSSNLSIFVIISFYWFIISFYWFIICCLRSIILPSSPVNLLLTFFSIPLMREPIKFLIFCTKPVKLSSSSIKEGCQLIIMIWSRTISFYLVRVFQKCIKASLSLLPSWKFRYLKINHLSLTSS